MGMKAEVFKTDALNAGWKAEIKTKGELSTVVATREEDGAVMSISWKGEACLNECIITVDGHTRKLRNAAACRRELSDDSTPTPKTSNSTPKAAKPVRRAAAAADLEEDDEQPRMPQPVWGRLHAEAPATDIFKAVRGRTITWLNALKGEVESATVLDKADQKQLRIEKSPVNGKRLISFAASEEGFRSVYIERIVSVA